MKIDDEYSWNDFEEHYYCPNCRNLWHIQAKGEVGINKEITAMKKSGIYNGQCQNCYEQGIKITDEMIETSKNTAKGKPMVFTSEELKEISDDYKKHINSIPTQENLYMKDYMKEYRKKAYQTS
jgi:hypothetical protein